MVFIVIIIVIIFIMPIKIVISKDEISGDVDIFFTKIFNVRLDFDELLRRLFSLRDAPGQITIQSIIYNIGLYKNARGILRTIAKMIKINKLTLIIKTKSLSLETDTWGYVFSWIFFGYFQNYIHGLFKRVENEYYNHNVAPTTNINFECKFNIRLFYILFSFIRNFKDIPKVIRFIRKGSKTYGTPHI